MTREDKIVDSVPMRKVNLCFHYTSKANWPQWKPAPWFREGHGTLLQHSCLENPTDGGAWWAAVRGSLRVGHDWVTSLSLFTFMHWRRKWQPTHSVLAWRIPGVGEPGGLSSMGSHRVGHNWSDLAAAAPWFTNRSERKSADQCNPFLDPENTSNHGAFPWMPLNFFLLLFILTPLPH